MSSIDADNFGSPPAPAPGFPTTHWTLVTRVREGGAVRQAALEELCRLYWYPIYAFLRRRGHAQQDAEDLTQGFFAKLLRDESFDKLRANFDETGRTGVFETLLPFLLMDDAPPSYREVARKLDSSETAVRLLVFRMRTRFRDLLRDEVARTVATPEEAEAEMGWLKSVLAGA